MASKHPRVSLPSVGPPSVTAVVRMDSPPRHSFRDRTPLTPDSLGDPSRCLVEAKTQRRRDGVGQRNDSVGIGGEQTSDLVLPHRDAEPPFTIRMDR
jgi:hypothetical protein